MGSNKDALNLLVLKHLQIDINVKLIDMFLSKLFKQRKVLSAIANDFLQPELSRFFFIELNI